MTASGLDQPAAGKDYVYHSDNKSILYPFYARWFWNKIAPRIPARIPPNALTLAGTLSAAAAFAASLAAAPGRSWPLFFSAAFILLHMSLDNLDGRHARRIGRTSRRGEFMDHWLDTFNSGFVTLAGCLALRLEPGLTLGMVAVANASFFAVHWAHDRTGVMRLGRMTDIEANSGTALAVLAAGVVDPRRWKAAVLFLCFCVAVNSLWVVGSIFLRVRPGRAESLPFFAATAALFLWFFRAPLAAIPLIVLMAELNVLGAGGFIIKRMRPSGRRGPPPAALFFLLLLLPPVLFRIFPVSVQIQTDVAWSLAALFLAVIIIRGAAAFREFAPAPGASRPRSKPD